MVATILPQTPPPPILGMGSMGQSSAFSEHGNVASQIKKNHECSNMAANILPADPPPPPPPHTHTHSGDGVHKSKFNVSQHGHGAYQTKKNQECSNKVANILPADHPC